MVASLGLSSTLLLLYDTGQVGLPCRASVSSSVRWEQQPHSLKLFICVCPHQAQISAKKGYKIMLEQQDRGILAAKEEKE